MKRIIFLGLVGGVLAASSGCGLCQAIFCYHPCVGCGDCCADGCGDGCDGNCGPACGRPCLARPCACGPRCARPCDGCDACCEPPCGRPCCAPAPAAAVPVASPVAIPAATVAAMGAASVAGTGDLSVACSPCSRPVRGADVAVAGAIGVISTVIRPIVGTPAIAMATIWAAGAAIRAAGALKAAVDAIIAAVAALSIRPPGRPARK